MQMQAEQPDTQTATSATDDDAIQQESPDGVASTAPNATSADNEDIEGKPVTKTPEAIEVELLLQAQNGDYDAYESLHKRLENPIRRFVRRLIGDTAEVDDVLQDTLISLYTNMHHIDPPENLRPYVFRIARNRCYDTLRKQGRFNQESLDDDAVNMRVSFNAHQRSNKPEDATHWLLLYIEVQEAIDLLPELQRQAIILFSEESLSYAEIAGIMDVSLGTVKSRLFHAKRTLRRLLKPETLKAIEGKL